MKSLIRALRRDTNRSFYRAHRGITLLEVKIVLTLVAFILGFVFGPRVVAMLFH